MMYDTAEHCLPCLTMITHAQDYEEAGSSSAPRPNMDVGQFPFQRGERAVFSFDQGDEVSINTSTHVQCRYFLDIMFIFTISRVLFRP